MTNPLATAGITRELLLAELAASSDPEMRKYAIELTKSTDWTPDQLFKMLAKYLGKNPRDILK